MSQSAPSPEIDLSWRMREQESQLLATLIRTSRLTLLSAEPGLDRTGLLAGGLLPLLRRRAGDAVGDEDREARVVIPFSDRRARRTGRSVARVAERVVLFDGWGGAPMPALRASILSSLPADAITYARSDRLAPMLGELTRRFDAHFLVVLEGFERFWHPDLSLEAAEQFVDEFSEAVNLDGLRANFLLSIDQVGEPKLDALRQRIAGFGDSSLHLLRWQSVATRAPSSPEEVQATTEVTTGETAEATTEATTQETMQETTQETTQEKAEASNGATAVSRTTPEPPTVPEGAVSLPPASALPVLRDVIAPPSRPAPKSSPTSAVAAKKPRRPRPPRVPFVKPAPIDTEGVYAFIESTLSQTASDFAPWHNGEGVSTTATGSEEPQTFSREPAGGRRAMPDDPAWKGRMPSAHVGRGADLSTSLVEPPSPIDTWLDSAFAWVRRRLPRK